MKIIAAISGFIFLLTQLLFLSVAIFDLHSAYSDIETYNKLYVNPQRNLMFDRITIVLFSINVTVILFWLAKRKVLLFYLFLFFSLLNIGLFTYSLMTNELYSP